MTAQLVKVLTATEPLLGRWNYYSQIPFIRAASLNNREISCVDRSNRTRGRLPTAGAKGFNGASFLQNNAAAAAEIKKDDDASRNGGDDQISDVVVKRILWRIVFYVGAPLTTGLLLLQVLGAARDVLGADVPKWVGLLTILITFGASALGIAFGPMSASWDADREGSFFGFEQVARNWADTWNDEEIDEE